MRQSWNKWIYFAIIVFAGAVCGSIFLQALPIVQQEELNDGMINYITWLKQSQFIDSSMLFWDVFFKHVKWAFVLILLGVSMVGVPLIVVLMFIKGFLLGSSLFMLVQSFGSEGIWYGILTIAPHNMIILPALIMLSSAAISFAAFLLNGRILGRGGAMSEQIISFSTVAMSMLLLLAGAALIEVHISPMLLRWYMAS